MLLDSLIVTATVSTHIYQPFVWNGNKFCWHVLLGSVIRISTPFSYRVSRLLKLLIGKLDLEDKTNSPCVSILRLEDI